MKYFTNIEISDALAFTLRFININLAEFTHSVVFAYSGSKLRSYFVVLLVVGGKVEKVISSWSNVTKFDVQLLKIF